MTIADFVSHLQSLDVRLSAEGERLRLNAPQGVLTDSLRSQIAERKQELLVFVRDKRASATSTPPPVVRRTTGNPAPLSFAQERLWFLEQLEPGSPVYNLCRAYRLMGKLNIFALELSLNEIVRRHEVLRSVIRVAESRPVQAARPSFEMKISVTDLQHLSDQAREQEISSRIQEATGTPFDFSAGKFLRTALLRLKNNEHVLILTTHHIVSDAWSMGILIRELWSFYELYAAGNRPFLDNLQIQYTDFAVWQREWLQGAVVESQLAYWKKQLADISILNLPIDRARPVRQSYNGARVSFELPESLADKIDQLSQSCNATAFMMLLAAFQVLLYRYTGQEDVIVGSPIANRPRTELDPLIGLFVNTLLLRSSLSGNPTFRELIACVREVCLGAYAHQDLPFEKLVQELQLERDQSRNPMFQVMFVLQNATRPFRGIKDLLVEPIEMAMTRSLFDLSLFLRERRGKYLGYIEYNTDLFNRDRIERMAGHLENLLKAIVSDPDQSIATVPILADVERHQILVEWNDTAADYPKDRCIHQLFEEQVERTPEATAVELEDQRITYRELNRRANQLAHYLISLGIGPEKSVGIFFERSVEMIVGLLGILKADGAYVPLNQNHPKARLQFMVEDAQISIILTQDNLVRDGQLLGIASQPSDYKPKIVCLASERDIITDESGENPENLSSSTNLAYIIYTSGSTGQPKGVEIEHRSIVNCLQAIRRLLEVTKNDALLAVTTISFDIATLELYLPLITGAKVILASRDDALEGKQLAEKVESSAVTMMQATASTWRLLIDVGWRPRQTFKILCGGEALSRRLADQLLDDGAALWNLYGPTETTIWSSLTRVEAGEGPPLIGRPIANTQIYILDAYLQPVPVGVHGELYIGGDGLARGYLNQPELTAEKFIPNPFSDQNSSRLYRTGDLARYRPDGNIEFLGRIDNQVKIRGHRVELVEVEFALNQHPSVKESVVVFPSFLFTRKVKTEDGVTAATNGTREEAPPSLRSSLEREGVLESDRKLIAYLTTNAEKPTATELRGFLSQKVPEYMIPSAFVVLDALPLTLNGKIDRSKLPSADGSRPEIDQEFVEPRSELEELVAQIWRELLKCDRIGVHDNFFELGGHSLLATQLVARLSDALNREIPLKTLFDAPTITSLLVSLESIARDGNTPKLPPIVPIARDGPLPLSMNQEHLWRLEQMMPGTHFFNMPYVYLLDGDLNVGALKQAVREIVRRHDALRTVFFCDNGKPLQIVNPVGNSGLSIVDLRLLKSDTKSCEAARLIVDERTQGFDLGKGPLLRAKLVQLTATKSLLLITLHHIISDHSSVHIIKEELITLYAAFCRKQESPLPEPQIQFPDFAVWEGKLLYDGLLNRQISYWKEQLSTSADGVPMQKLMPSASFYFCREQIEFDVDLFRKVKTFANTGVYTPFMIMVAALSVVIHCQTKNRQIRIGTLVATRGKRETGVLIGYLMNTIILRIDVSPDMTLEELLTSARRVTLNAFAHEELPFEYLAQTMEKEQNSQRALLFETLLIYQRSSPRTDETFGLKLAPLEVNDERVEPEVLMSNVPLILRLRETSTTLTGTVNYKINNFSSTDVVRMRKRIDATLRNIVAESIRSVPVGSLIALF